MEQPESENVSRTGNGIYMEEVGEKIRLSHIDANGNKLLLADMTPVQLKKMAAVMAAQAIGIELKQTMTPEEISEIRLPALMRGILASFEISIELLSGRKKPTFVPGGRQGTEA